MFIDIGRLRRMISAPQGCCCTLDDNILYDLIMRYPCYELAAYHACLMMACNDSMTLSDGTGIPSQRQYWLTRARQFRPSVGGALTRADEVKHDRK